VTVDYLRRLPDVIERMGLSRSTIYGQVAAGLFPPPVSLGARSVAWPESEIVAVVGARIAGATAEEVRALVVDLVAKRSAARRIADAA
jgi:prophage regulatory protein